MKRALKLCFYIIILGAILGLYFFLTQEGPLIHQATPPVKKENLRVATDLMAEITLELQNLPYAIYPNSPLYNTARFDSNKRFNVFPHAILCPRTVEEASSCLKALKKNHLPFAVRSGGHSSEGASLSPGYIFDLRNFNAIVPDIKTGLVKIGAGCKQTDIHKALGDHAIPTGTCPKVGIAGLALGGGIGVLSRAHGLTCDAIKSITLLNAEGEILEVSGQEHSDLFWALRGAGNGSYGIVLAFTFKMQLISHVSYYELTWNWDREKLPNILATWQEWIRKLPNNISSKLSLSYSLNKIEIRICGLKVGRDNFREWEKPFKTLHPMVKIWTGTYAQSEKFWGEEPHYPLSKMKSNFLMHPLPPEVLPKIISFFEQLMSDKAALQVLLDFDAMGGKIPKNNTSFFPRKALALWSQGIYWDKENQTSDALRYIRKFQAEILPYVSKYSYVGWLDYDIGAGYLNAYYGDKVGQLIEVKRKYDPENFFRFKQSIPLKK